MSAVTAFERSNPLGKPEAHKDELRESAPDQAPTQATQPKGYNTPRKIEWGYFSIMVAIHLAALGSIFTGVTTTALVMFVVFYVVRMWAITAGYHRYFAHRTYKTGRVFQFILAFLSQTSAQRGVLWWAAHHRDHHKYSDGPQDLHSPRQDGFWYSHVLWIYNRNGDTKFHRIRDMAKYPELRLLDRFWWAPPWILGIASFLIGGLPGLFFSFFFGTVVLWHATFTINSLSHVYGKQRFDSGDDSRNNWLLALLTFGEGWHNNHHYHMSSTRQGFYWWEVDLTYYVLKVLSWFGIVWDLREPTQKVLDEGRARDRAAAAVHS